LKQYNVQEIEAAAWNLLNRLYGSFIQVPIDVELLIEKHPNVTDFDLVKGLSYKHGLAGLVLRLKENSFSILVDSDIADKNPFFYRFTVSEELSHLVLHKDLINDTDSIAKAVKFKSNPNYKIIDRNAKRFAAALLMPNRLVVRDAEKLFHNIVLRNGKKAKEKILAEIITALRKKYDVSKETMFYRLNEWPLRIIERVEFSLENESTELLIIE